MVKWLSLMLAAAGIVLAVYAVASAVEPPKELPPARPPSVNPFGRGFAALGFVETSTRETEIAAPEAGLVMDVLVHVNDRVEAGQALFKLDPRVQEAALVRAEAALQVGRIELDRLLEQPRAEDLPPLEAALERAEAVYAERTEELARFESAREQNAATDWDLRRLRIAADEARALVHQAEADLAKVRAGAWSPDVAIARSKVEQLEADVGATRLLVDRLTVKAQRSGVVLRRDIEPGEYADATRPLMVLGDLSSMNIRAEVDEEDLPLLARALERRTQTGAEGGTRGTGDAGGTNDATSGLYRQAGSTDIRAVARTRGALPKTLTLDLLRIEPLARRKTDLSGSNSERIDTRVIDVVFRVTDRAGALLVPGAAVDVFVDTGAEQPVFDAR